MDVPCWRPNITRGVDCQDPLIVVDGLYCSLVCPLPSLTDSQYTSAKIMQGIVSWFSWVFSSVPEHILGAPNLFLGSVRVLTRLLSSVSSDAKLSKGYDYHDCRRCECAGERLGSRK